MGHRRPPSRNPVKYHFGDGKQLSSMLTYCFILIHNGMIILTVFRFYTAIPHKSAVLYRANFHWANMRYVVMNTLLSCTISVRHIFMVVLALNYWITAIFLLCNEEF